MCVFMVRSFIYINKWDSQTHSPIDLSNKTKKKKKKEQKESKEVFLDLSL